MRTRPSGRGPAAVAAVVHPGPEVGASGRLRGGLPRRARVGRTCGRQGLYSSQITEWRKLRDAGVLEGKQPGEKVGRPTAEQAEIARLRRELDRAERRLATTETALEIMGKAHALLEEISESAEHRRAGAGSADGHLPRAHRRRGHDPGRGRLTGLPRATADPAPTPTRSRPAAAAGAGEPAHRRRAEARSWRCSTAASSSTATPLQVYATLLGRGQLPVLGLHHVPDPGRARPGQRTAPARPPPGPGAARAGRDRPGAGVHLGHHQAAPARPRAVYYDAYVMIDIYSRYIVGARVHAARVRRPGRGDDAAVFGLHGTPHVVHADRGTSMTSKTVAALLADLGVTRSHSRPAVSQRQPVLRGLVQDDEVRPGLPRPVRLTRRRPRSWTRSSTATTTTTATPASACTPPPTSTTATPPPSTRPRADPRRGTRTPPRTVHHQHRPEDPPPARRRLDQPTTRRSRSLDP